MILKSFEINKINLITNKIILFYGKNEGYKNEEINKIKKRFETIEKYDEKKILDNIQSFYEQLTNESLFEKEKLIIIDQTSDKIINIIKDLLEMTLKDVWLILNSGILEKKSKLRNLFEKDKKLICIPFYPDTNEILFKITQNFFKKNKILISNENINFIINKCSGDRGYLINELEKIELFSLSKKNVSNDEIFKLINLTENFDINELIDNCLAKNHKKTLNILNESNFSNEECIMIIRMFLNKLKRILELTKQYQINQDLNLTINNAKPPIFWKDKEITKKQIYRWKSKEIEKLIIDINTIELQIKKNSFSPINLVSDFIMEKSL